MQQRPALYWTTFRIQTSALCLAATPAGICYVGIANNARQALAKWAAKHLPDSQLVRDHVQLEPHMVELIKYFQGTHQRFAAPLALQGTPFQLAVWNALLEIPYGATRSYSDIARHIQKTAAVRAVGAAVGANPVLILVPCHRVIGKDGSLTGFREGLELKRKLLALESGHTALFRSGVLEA